MKLRISFTMPVVKWSNYVWAEEKNAYAQRVNCKVFLIYAECSRDPTSLAGGGAKFTYEFLPDDASRNLYRFN